jgi:DNA-binding protein H-NS
MPKTYADYLAQIDKLRAEAEALRRDEVAGVVARIKEAIKQYGITPQELGFTGKGAKRSLGAKSTTKARGVTTAKYSDAKGNTWGGRGPRPKWLRDALAEGHSLDDFAVGQNSSARAPRAAASAPEVAAPIPATPKARRNAGAKKPRAAGKKSGGPAKAARRGRSKPSLSQGETAASGSLEPPPQPSKLA